ncbi:hypothetical protein H4R34_000461 [Dimargaris verticillata]|uniref:Fungal lipase-type domain-containing protein n=1 Tax=Dimargaris verticillata TaxID=2761393 RepID=A0A9W8BCM3_9FUNG|nr:hypothetical protein H4R34_000461 [Dimargaris verticillata]
MRFWTPLLVTTAACTTLISAAPTASTISVLAQPEVDGLKPYAHLAAAAYHSLTQWDCAHCAFVPNTRLEYFFATPGDATVGYVATNADMKTIIVAFRGSRSIAQWITNLVFVPVDWPPKVDDSKVHLGFLTSYHTVADRVYDKVTELLKANPDYSISLTGHSLGGALSSVAAVDFARRDSALVPKLNVVTFGKPRVGNIKYAAYYNSLNIRTTRVVNKADIVPHLPLFTIADYTHEQGEVWIQTSNAGGKTVRCASVNNEENRDCSYKVDMLLTKIPDHMWAWDVFMLDRLSP